MRRRHKRNQEENGLDLTPMMDIVFIMLIFFIVTTSFVKETGIEVNRPNAETAERDEKEIYLLQFLKIMKFGLINEELI